jgi:hypothetical protein
MRRFLLYCCRTASKAIRSGFFGNRYRREKLAPCRRLVGMPAQAEQTNVPPAEQDYRDRFEELTGLSLHQCPHCQQGHMLVVEPVAVAVQICTTFGLVGLTASNLRPHRPGSASAAPECCSFPRLPERAWSNNRVKMSSRLNSAGPGTHSENRTELSPPTNTRRPLLSPGRAIQYP